MDYKIEYFDKYKDNRGDLIVFLRSKNLKKNFKKFGQIYFVTFNKKGTIRANHYHKEIREWFGVANGKVKVVLLDVRTKKKKTLILNSKSNKFIRVEIGPYIAHGLKSLSDSVSVLNYTDKEWTSNDVIFYEAIK